MCDIILDQILDESWYILRYTIVRNKKIKCFLYIHLKLGETNAWMNRRIGQETPYSSIGVHEIKKISIFMRTQRSSMHVHLVINCVVVINQNSINENRKYMYSQVITIPRQLILVGLTKLIPVIWNARISPLLQSHVSWSIYYFQMV